MSNKKECKELLVRYTTARIPFISLDTMERGRALEILETVADELCLTFYVHTMSKGTYDILTKKVVNEDRTIYGALDYMCEQMKNRQNLTMILTEMPDISDDNDTAKQVLDAVMMAEECGGEIIVLNQDSIWNHLQRLGMIVHLDVPNEDEMYDIIKEYIDDYRQEIEIEWDSSDIREAAACLTGVTRIEAQNVIASLIATKRIRKEDIDEIRFAKDKLFSDISGLEKIPSDDKVLEVGGLDGLKKWLDEKKQLLSAEKREEMKSRGLQPPRGILLVGVPGCGKSLSAKAIASSWKLPLYRLDFATVQGQYVGQSEQQLKNALNTAEHMSPCVLWIDEIEKGLSGSAGSDGGVSTRMVGQFLFWLQECRKQVFVVATANDVSMLPPELLRRGRFDELFFVDLPNETERKEIIKLYMNSYLHHQLDDLMIEKLVELTRGYTGADIESAVREIAYHSLLPSFDLNNEVIIATFENVVPLSQTRPEDIESIRDWGKSRAVPASGRPIGDGENLHKECNRIRKVLVY